MSMFTAPKPQDPRPTGSNPPHTNPFIQGDQKAARPAPTTNPTTV